MKVFHELAFDAYVAQSATAQSTRPYSDPRLQELMGAVDMLHVSGYAAQVSGTSPLLTIAIQQSNDRSIWYDASVTPVINGVSIPAGQETICQGNSADPAANGRFAFARLGITLSGTGVQAYLRVWVTGRDFSRRSAGGAAGQPMSPRPMGSYGRKG
jgi:hypothetical protein